MSGSQAEYRPEEDKAESRTSNFDVSQKDVVDKADFSSSATKHPELAAEDVLDKNHPFYGEFDEHSRPIPGWREQITIRAIVLSTAIGFLFCVMVMKIGLIGAVVPSLNIAAGLIGFAGIKAWVGLTTVFIRGVGGRTGFRWLRWLQLDKPFTRQENCVIQTTVVAIYGLVLSGGFTHSLLKLDWNSYLANEGSDELFPNGVPKSAYSRVVPEKINGKPVHPKDVVQPHLGKLMALSALIYFIGLFVLVPYRKLFILKYRLTYPSGTATGTIINNFHTPFGESKAKKQLRVLGKWFAVSFIFSAIKWCFSGPGGSCGLDELPLLGIKARSWMWYETFNQSMMGVGLLVPKHIVYGITLGAAITWGIMWPVINNHKKGVWFDEKYAHPSLDIRGLAGYMIFTCMGLYFGDAAYNITKLIVQAITDWYKKRPIRDEMLLQPDTFAQMRDTEKHQTRLEALRDHVFVKDELPTLGALGVYIALAGITTGVLPQLYSGVKWYYILIAYVLAPIMGFGNAYVTGLSDWDVGGIYGSLGVLIFAAWQGPNGGIIAGAIISIVIVSITSVCCSLMQDFKTGYLTLASPRSMLAAQTIGAAIACIIAPCAFWLYWSGFNLGDPNGPYKVPFAATGRGTSRLMANGGLDLPKHWERFLVIALVLAVVLDLLRDALARWISPTSIYVKLVPIPSMLGLTGIVGGFFTVDITIGGVILGLWQYFSPASALENASIVASGLIAGDGLWMVPSAITQIAGISAPFCAQFWTSKYYEDKNIGNLVEGQPANKSSLTAPPASAPAPHPALAPL